MELTSKNKIIEILEKHNAKPTKKLGQNFIINKNAVDKIISNIGHQNTVVEIGPGLGTLTLELSKKLKNQLIIAVEKDFKMINILKETLADINNVSIIHQDALVFIKNIKISKYEVVACLPYCVATPIIRLFLESEKKPEQMILTIQKEVAQRICANPPNMNILAVSVQFYGQPKILFNISKNSFWPQPQVNSSVIKIVPHKSFCFDKKFCHKFFEVVRAGFSRPRAQLLNNLSKKLKLEKKNVERWLSLSGINPMQRAETLDVEKWICLTKKSI